MPEEIVFSSHAELGVALDKISLTRAHSSSGAPCRSQPATLSPRTGTARSVAANSRRYIAPTLEEVPRQWVMIDIDGWPLRDCDDLVTDPDGAIEHAIYELLPEPFHNATCWWQLSSSAGFAVGILKAHLFFWLSEPADNLYIKAVLREHAPAIDLSPFSAAQPHFIAAPIIDGGHDPVPRRTGWRQGLEQQVILPAPTPSWRPERRSSTAPGGISGGVELLGDGDGLGGFHRPLRTTTLRYARQCQRSGARDDDALKAQLRAAIEAAPRDSRIRTGVEEYTSDSYLDRLIFGAFALLAGNADGRTIKPHHRLPTDTLQQARAALAQYIVEFFNGTLEWHAMDKAEAEAEHSAMIVGVGTGKSSETRKALPAFIKAAKAAGQPHRILWLVPTHKLGGETLEAMLALGINAAVMRGREADDPDDPGSHGRKPAETMCPSTKLPGVKDCLLIHGNIEKDVCGNLKDRAVPVGRP